MDVDQVVTDLYGLRPAQFIAARDARVAEARQAKDPAAARRLAALRRPTTAAWASNLFVRRRPKEAERLLALGATLREAHRTLDAGQFREARKQQHQMIAALARETATLAQEAGPALSEPVRHEVEQILHRVLADPDLAREWAAGRLTKVPEATVDFSAVTPDTAPARKPAAASPEASSRRRGRQGAADQAQLDAARRAAEDTAADATRREVELSEAEQAHQAAEAPVEQTQARVAELEQQLRQARKDEREARAAADLARTAAQEARRAAMGARRTAARAAANLTKLDKTADEK